jgi:hypothetical protein
MNWLWLNIPLMAVFFVAVTGIPLWLTFKHPDRRPAQSAPAQARAAQGQAWSVPGQIPTTIKVRAAGSDDWRAVPELARR